MSSYFNVTLRRTELELKRDNILWQLKYNRQSLSDSDRQELEDELAKTKTALEHLTLNEKPNR